MEAVSQSSSLQSPDSSLDRWITADEAAAILGLGAGRQARALAREEGWPTITEACRGGHRLRYRLADVTNYLDKGLKPLADAAPESDLQPTACSLQPEITRKLKILAPVIAAAEGKKGAAIKRAAKAAGVAPRTIHRWLAQLEQAGGDQDALADGRRGNRNAAKIDQDTLEIIYSIHDSRYSPTYEQVLLGYDQHRREHPEENLPEISISTLRYALRKIPPAVLERGRGGNPTRTMTEDFIPPIERDWTTTRVMQTWMGDATVWDMRVTHPDFKTPIRPMLAWVMDVRSRCIVSWRLSVRLDGGVLLLVLREGWLRYGLCGMFYYDNGSEVINKDGIGWVMKNGVDEVARVAGYFKRLDIPLIRAGVRHPEGKAPVERSFATLSGHFLSLFPGHTGGNITSKTRQVDADRLKQDVKRGNLFTFAEAEELAARIVTAYNCRPHDGLGKRRPYDVFHELYGKSADGHEEHPVIRASAREIDFACRRREHKSIQSKGFEIFKCTYRPDQGAGDDARRDRDRYLEATGRKGYVAYDPADMRQVYLYQLVNGREEYVCALYPYSGIPATDAQEMRRAMQEQKRQQKTIKDARNILLRRDVDADRLLQQGVLHADPALAAEHDARFPARGTVSLSGVEGHGSPADVLHFPTGGLGGTPKPTASSLQPTAEEDPNAALLANYDGLFGEKHRGNNS